MIHLRMQISDCGAAAAIDLYLPYFIMNLLLFAMKVVLRGFILVHGSNLGQQEVFIIHNRIANLALVLTLLKLWSPFLHGLLMPLLVPNPLKIPRSSCFC